jgi:hypothetical protein
MDAWRARLLAARATHWEDDEEEEFKINWLLALGFQEDEVVVPPVWGGLRPRRSTNVNRHRQHMHDRMIEDYLCEAPVFGPML